MNIMKRLGLITLFFALSLTIYCQTINELYVGFNGGFTYSNISTKNNIASNYDFKGGFLSGLNFGFKLKSKLSIETNINFYQNGYNENEKVIMISPDYSAKNSYLGFKNLYTQDYINNSWLIGYSFGNKIEIIVQAGAYWAYLIQSRYEKTNLIDVDPIDANKLLMSPGYTESIQKGTLAKSANTQFDLGLSAGFGLGYNLNEKFKVLFNARYNRGIIDYSKQVFFSPITSYNNSFNFTFGLRMKI